MRGIKPNPVTGDISEEDWQAMHPADRWIERLWSRLEMESANHSGDVVVRLLREASNEIWDAGLDAEFAELEADDLSEKAPAFDITWMTTLLLKIIKAPVRDKRKAPK